MNKRTRQKRAILRDRRRGHEGQDLPAIIGPLTGFDLFLMNRYGIHVNRCSPGDPEHADC